MGLRSKFLLLMILVPSACLGLFLYFAVSTFVADRVSSLFESQLRLLGSVDYQVRKTAPENLHAEFKELFRQDGFEDLLVVDGEGTIRDAGHTDLVGKKLIAQHGSDLVEKLAAQSTREGGFEYSDLGKTPTLASFESIGDGSRKSILLLLTPKSVASRASLVFLYKAMATFVALISFAVLASLWLSSRMTKGIVQLSGAMTAFGKGDFVAPVPSLSDDEIGQMTRQFKLMRTQIQTLFGVREAAAKAETEMNLAAQLQSRFFPVPVLQLPNAQFAGFIEAANNAGGDWWFHFQSANKFIFLIGDVTGHGLNAAMLTGVSRSAFSLIQENFESPAISMGHLNRAIFDSAKNELNMTCCICALDLDTGAVEWCNASHESPLVIPAVDGDIKSKEFKFLVGTDGPRLGESREVLYTQQRATLKPGEGLLLFSDGVTDLQNPDGKLLAERGLLKAVGTQLKAKATAGEILLKVKEAISKHRSGHPLVDDVSFLVVKWRTA